MSVVTLVEKKRAAASCHLERFFLRSWRKESIGKIKIFASLNGSSPSVGQSIAERGKALWKELETGRYNLDLCSRYPPFSIDMMTADINDTK